MSVYAVADLHGQYNLWEQIRDYLKPEDKLIILGDCVDRGERGFDILMEACADSRCLVLKGNHELMMQQYLERPADSFGLAVWKHNGAEATLAALPQDEHGKKALLGLLEMMPRYAMYNKVLLTHAGCTPTAIDLENFDEEDLLWDRGHFYDEWKSTPQVETVVFGHTPIPNLEQELENWQIPHENQDGIKLTFADGHKICIDAGCFATKHIGLLDLDTFEIKEFSADESRI